MDDWKERLYQEQEELEARLNKLRNFILESPEFMALPNIKRRDLREQRHAMEAYNKILMRRINRSCV